MAKDDNSVIFLKDWKVLIQSLSTENQIIFWELFTSYEYELEQECDNDYVRPIWNFVKSQLDNMKHKYITKTVLTNQLNGSKGGRPKKTQENPNNPMGLGETQITPKDKDNNKDNNKVNEKDITPTAFSFYKSLISLGADSKLANEWMAVRKKKKSTDTETALDGFVREMEKSGLEINAALRICIEKSWAGLNSKWLKDEDIAPKADIIPGETQEERTRRLYVERMRANPMKMTY